MLATQLGVDDRVRAKSRLEVCPAENTLARVAAALRDDLRRGVREVDEELDSLERVRVERPRRQQPKRACGDAPAARVWRDDVARLRLLRVELELHERDEAEELAALRAEDCEARVRSLVAAAH